MKCNWNEKIKKLDCWDIKLIKLSSIAGGLAIFKVVKIIWGWDAFSISVWYWLAIAVVLAVRPLLKAYYTK